MIFPVRFAQTPRVAAWQDARTIGVQWVVETRAGSNLAGQIILLPDFESDEDCRFFYTDRAIAFHRMVLKAAGRFARTSGYKLVKHIVTQKDYRAWLREKSLTDSPEERLRFIQAQAKIAG